MKIDLSRKWLAVLWFSVGGVLFAFVLLQTLLGHYRGVEGDVWGWLFSSILPTLSLMIAVLVTDARGAPDKETSLFVFRLTFGLSSLYLVTVFLTLLLSNIDAMRQPFTAGSPTELMKQAQQLWLAPFQGLVSASLGAFFLKK